MGIDVKRTRYCKRKNCNNIIREHNKSGVCSNCSGNSFFNEKFKEKEKKLKERINFLERQNKLCFIVLREYYFKLKKYEDIKWVDEYE